MTWTPQRVPSLLRAEVVYGDFAEPGKRATAQGGKKRVSNTSSICRIKALRSTVKGSAVAVQVLLAKGVKTTVALDSAHPPHPGYGAPFSCRTGVSPQRRMRDFAEPFIRRRAGGPSASQIRSRRVANDSSSEARRSPSALISPERTVSARTPSRSLKREGYR
jgi:hypothetical protein